jgi:phosphatidate cytidylyltransferase
MAALWVGHLPFMLMLGLVAVGLAHEIREMSRRRGGALLFWGGSAVAMLALAGFLWLREDAVAGRMNVMFVVLVVWASDIGAYLFGRLVGGPRLAPRVSPGKTWSGAAGGLGCAIAVGWAASVLVPALDPGGETGSTLGVAVAGFLGLMSQIGDLLESALKRYVGVKDSGRLIPGHGGLLDRLDGLILAAIASALVSMMFGRGVLLWQ